MTPTEARVAQAAVDVGKQALYEDIYEKVSDATGVHIDRVKELVEKLVGEGVLCIKGGPSQNLAEGGFAGAIVSKAWYVRGDCWPGDSHS